MIIKWGAAKELHRRCTQHHTDSTTYCQWESKGFANAVKFWISVFSTTQESVPSFLGSLCENVTWRGWRIPTAWPWGFRVLCAYTPLCQRGTHAAWSILDHTHPRHHWGDLPAPHTCWCPLSPTHWCHSPARHASEAELKSWGEHGVIPKARDVQPSNFCLTPDYPKYP